MMKHENEVPICSVFNGGAVKESVCLLLKKENLDKGRILTKLAVWKGGGNCAMTAAIVMIASV